MKMKKCPICRLFRKLKRLWVVYPGKAAYRLTEKIQVIPLADVRDTWYYG
jgi:hypothetical protein